ncbi:coiled-coil domain-containing protein 178 [Sceloporus undulatus]|uniref:coiled-coil domain-containing protein 178 n=1 Tax=Sceloporus undulatus TaxID=8520 RepID=UPI001C4D60C0|nr:coiled-coil domain-containing protein 178 [Sceloporus undulatus]
MTDLHLLSTSFKNNSQQLEGINEKIALDLPSRQRSCAAVSTPAACVNKAIHHIQDLEVKVEEAFQWYDQLYRLEKVPRDTDIKSVEEARWLSASSEQKAEPSFFLEAIQPLKQKTAAVLAEATELVTRLENERKEAEEALELERRRKKKLYQHADYLSLWRLQQLPIAVQREWEKYSQDVTELQWHIEEKNLQLQDAVNQLTKIDSANAKILEHIDFMKKYSPLLGEKLSFESDSIVEVKKKYTETKTVYDIVHEKLVSVKAINEELTVECEQKRKSMSEQILSAEDMVDHLMRQIKDAEKFYADLCAKINEKKEEILQHKKRLEELIKQEADAKADLLSWQDKVRRLNLKIDEQENENKILLDGYLEEMQNMQSSKTTQDSDIKNLKDKLMRYLQEITRLQDESKRLHDENGTFLQKFRDSSKRKVGYQTEIQVLRKNIRRLEDHLKRVNTDLYTTDLNYDDAKDKLEELSQNIAKEKMRFKNLEDNIKQKIKDEVSAWKLTQKRVKALKADLAKSQKEHAKLKEKIQKKLAELDRLVAEQTEILTKNKEKQKNLSQEIASLKQKIKELDEKEKKIKEELEDQKKCFQNLLNYIQEKYLDISNQLAKVNEDIAKYQNEINKLTALNKGTQKQMDTTEKSIAELRIKYAKIKSKEQNAQTLVDFLHNRLDYIEKKVKTDNRIFEAQLWKRQENLKAKKNTLKDTMDENLRLAQEYQMLQLCFLNNKNEFTDFYDHKVRAEAALRDQQQLSQLQRKLHRVLVKYFKLQALYNQARLAKFQAASHENVQKILAVQEGLSETLEHTDTFLKSLTDGSSTWKDNANNDCVLDAEG